MEASEGAEVSKYTTPLNTAPPSSVNLPIPVARKVAIPSAAITIPAFGHSPNSVPFGLSSAEYVA